MANPSLKDAIIEAYARAPTEVVILDTLQISHPALAEDLFLVQDLVANDFTLEDLSVETFEPVGFRFTLPATGDRALQELALEIDNTDLRITDFINTIKNQPGETKVRYRPYLSTDLTSPQMDPPLLLFLKNISINESSIQGRATFADIINRKFPNQLYTRARFPSLGNQ